METLAAPLPAGAIFASPAAPQFAACEQLYEWYETLRVSAGCGQFVEEIGQDPSPGESRFGLLRLEHDQGPPRGLEC